MTPGMDPAPPRMTMVKRITDSSKGKGFRGDDSHFRSIDHPAHSRPDCTNDKSLELVAGNIDAAATGCHLIFFDIVQGRAQSGSAPVESGERWSRRQNSR